MPTFYGPRKSNRGQWSQVDLDRAIKAVQIDKVSIRRAARENNIPEKTLHRRLTTGKFKKGSLGKSSHLGTEAEDKLVAHIQKLQSLGFSPTRQTLRQLAYSLSQLMGLKGPFNEKKKIAGTYWCMLFMKRNPTLHIRKADSCVSMARSQGLDKHAVNEFFKLLTKTFIQNDLFNKPGNIFTMDENCLKLQGEIITVVACCNAIGNFIPPYCIVKGANNELLKESLPPGSVVEIQNESAEFNEKLFMDWFENHFIVWKPAGKCVLILDDHPSHMNSLNMLEIAIKHDIILQCLPSLSSYYLQPLHKSFFKPLNTAYKKACEEFIKDENPEKRIDLCDFSLLFSNAWFSTANVANATSGFNCTGIWPLQPSVIPDSAYQVFIQSTSSDIVLDSVVSETPSSSLAKCLQKLSSDGLIEENSFDGKKCVECLNTRDELEEINWIQCMRCLHWLHDACSVYSDKCALCGRIINKQKARELTEAQSSTFDVQQETSTLEDVNGLLNIKEEVTLEETNLDEINRNFPKVEPLSDEDEDDKIEQECEYIKIENHSLEEPVSDPLIDSAAEDSVNTTGQSQNKKRKLSEIENATEEDNNLRNDVRVKLENEEDHLDYCFQVANRLQNSNQNNQAIIIAKQKMDEILSNLERGAFKSS